MPIKRKPISPYVPPQTTAANCEENPTAFPSFASICCHCHEGIPFRKLSHFCEFCKLRICSSCRGCHTHNSSPVTPVFDIHIQLRPVDYCAESEKCSGCQRPFFAGFACDECPERICSICRSDPERALSSHQGHRRFIEWLPPYGGLSSKFTPPKDHSECNHADSWKGHCSMCYRDMYAFVDDQYTCLSCPAQYLSDFCRDCFQTAKKLDSMSHRWISYKGTKPQVDEGIRKEAIHCADCDMAASSITDEAVKAHHHSSFVVTVKEHLEYYCRRSLYRRCLLKKPREDPIPQPTPGSFPCSACQNKWPIDEMKKCQRCFDAGAATILCRNCFPVCSRHWHDVSDFIGGSTSDPVENLPNYPIASETRYPDVIHRIERDTGRHWYQSCSNVALTSFEKPTPLPDDWTWWEDAFHQTFYVNRKRDAAIRNSPLEIPCAAWSDPSWIDPEWSESGNKLFIRNVSLTLYQIAEYQSSSYGFQETYSKWPLNYALIHTGDEHKGPWFQPIHEVSVENMQPTPSMYGPIHEDVRIARVQWKPLRLPVGWMVCPLADGRRIRLFDPQDDGRLVNTPPEPTQMELSQTPMGEPLYEVTFLEPLEYVDSAIAISPSEIYRPRQSRKGSGALEWGMKLLDERRRSNYQQQDSAQMPLVRQKRKMSKLEMANLSLKVLTNGINVGSSILGLQVSVPSIDLTVFGGGGGGSTDGFATDATVATVGSQNTFASVGGAAPDPVQG